jgi:putative restriction endonuclease
MCGFDGWLGGEVIGLDAAHVRWWAIGGPDSIDNALALCTLHHRLFDRGVVGLADDATVMVSQLFVGRAPAAQAQVLSLAGAPLLPPQAGHPGVADTHRGWHTEQVFRAPARLAA